MVELSLIIAIVVFFVAAVIAFKIIKSILKTIVVVIALTSVVLGVSAFFIVTDFNDFKEGFENEQNLFLVVKENKVISALEAGGSETKAVNKQETDVYSGKLEEGKPEEILNGYYKVFIINTAMFEEDKSIDSTLTEKLEAEIYPEERVELLTPVIEKMFADPVFLIVQYKKGNLEIYEETAMFKAVKLIPVSLVKSIADKAISKTKSIVVDKIE